MLPLERFFGLYDWKFEVMGLLHHTLDLERQFGIGPHTISFPRMTPALGSWLSNNSEYIECRMIISKTGSSSPAFCSYCRTDCDCKGKAAIKREVLQLCCTQTDASTRIGIGAYSDQQKISNEESQQFTIGDPRDLMR